MRFALPLSLHDSSAILEERLSGRQGAKVLP
jgi:hypothetical protein